MSRYKIVTLYKTREFIESLDKWQRAKIDRIYYLFEEYGPLLPITLYMNRKNLISHKELHKKWMKDPEFRREYEKLEPEFQIARQIIGARIKRKMSQEELAKKAGTGQAVISRLEGMNAKPSLSLLTRVAQALCTKIQVIVS